MKLRDYSRGITYDDIDKARHAYCDKRFPYIKDCNSCEIGHRKNFSGALCGDFCERYPHDAAAIMGYRVIGEKEEP